MEYIYPQLNRIIYLNTYIDICNRMIKRNRKKKIVDKNYLNLLNEKFKEVSNLSSFH